MSVTVSCATTPPSPASAPASVSSAPALPTDRRAAGMDLSGQWSTGSANEPQARRITVRPRCNYSESSWILDQAGDTLRAWMSPGRQSQGIATRNVERPRPAVGTVHGVDVVLDDGAAHYRLRYDSTSGHLRGTLDGQPFWAARQAIERPSGCRPVP